MYLSELICQARQIVPPLGNLEGKCCFCGRETAHGHHMEFSNEFTNANLLSGGSVICEYCMHMQKAEIPGAKQSAGKLYRANAWYASEEGMGVIRFPKKEKKAGDQEFVARDLSAVFALPERTPRSILEEPPDAPFAIYLTKSYKKTGWQTMTRSKAVARSRDLFPVGLDYDVILVSRQKLLFHLEFIDELRARGLTKTELETGVLGPKALAKIDMQRDVVDRLQKLAGDAIWGLAVFVA